MAAAARHVALIGRILFLVVLTAPGCSHRAAGPEVLVYGSSPGAVGAAIGAARAGARVCLVSELAWIGGTMTAEGVSVLDGNHKGANTGVVREFRKRVRAHYGPQADLATQISNCAYEPRVGENILQSMVREAGAQMLGGYRFAGLQRELSRQGDDPH
jgi:alkyl hydroperoxide reductase subunit AhpF